VSYSSREQSLPLATEGYVLGVRERFIQNTKLSDGIVAQANIAVKDVKIVTLRISAPSKRLNLSLSKN